MTLRERIEQEIRERGPIPFSRYMGLCLYHPELGYYARHAEKFGKAGDFYTSSDVHAVFGRLLARQFDEMWRVLGSPERIDIAELGPGRGLFARDVLDWSEKKFPEFFAALHYRLVEASPALRAKLAQTLDRRLAEGKCSVGGSVTGCTAVESWEMPEEPVLKPLPAAGKLRGTGAPILNHATHLDAESSVAAGAGNPAGGETIVFANEFFDALPVEIIGLGGSLRIARRDGRLVETWVDASAEELEFLDKYGVHPGPGERVEAPLVAQDYMARVAAGISRGYIIAIDYGYTRAELLQGRHRGTVMTYRQHSASPNPYEAPGEQDITAHVNFTAMAAAAEQAGMQTHKLLTQSQFLMGIGEANQFADAFEECRLPQERAKVALQLKHLVTPAGMGESFQVLVASKGLEKPKAAKLIGLRFGTAT